MKEDEMPQDPNSQTTPALWGEAAAYPPPAPPLVSAVALSQARRNYALFSAAGLVIGIGAGLLLAQIDLSSPSQALSVAVADCGVEDDPYIQLGDEDQSVSMDSFGKESEGAEYTDIICVLDAVAMPDSVVNRMDSTRALDGRQSAEWDDFSATWGYHPDSGMNVVVEVVDED